MIRISGFRIFLFQTLVCLFCVFAIPAGATDKDSYPPLPLSDFRSLPVQHDGRIKPVDTFARTMLSYLSGHESVGGMEAGAWLAETLFDPAKALHRPVFRIFRPQLVGLPEKDSRYYSYAELAPALDARREMIGKLLEADPKTLGEDQKEIIRLHESSILYTQLLRAFSALLPLNIRPPAFLGIAEDKPFTVNEFRRHEQKLQTRVKSILKNKGEDPDKYSQEEKEILSFAMNMQILRQGSIDNVLFRIVPGTGREWFSPWALGESGQGSPASAAYLKHWEDMARAYIIGDAAAWADAAAAARAESRTFAPSGKIAMELFYGTWHPQIIAGGLYLLAFGALVAASLAGIGWARTAALAFLFGGCAAQALAITLRILILERPPVGTLYESIIFVAFLCALIGALYEWMRKDGIGLFTGAGSALILLFVAQGFAEEDTMKMLVAVLNTNFWLATHVLCITMGYGWCVITSAFAHIWLYRAARGAESDVLVKPVKTLALISLLFTAVGTILGGIWADQSWGRFWGWDPKENGALLIVLWIVWILHAQIAGQIGRRWFMAGMAYLSVIVSLAWFGVNLLNTGLHSYGFISGIAFALGAFCVFETAFIGGMIYAARPRTERTA